jgi:preprotein translocase SecE subunit
MAMTQAAKLNTTAGSSGSGASRERERPAWLEQWLNYPRQLRQFLHETRVEMKQVTWPSQSEVLSTTIVVILTTAFFAVFLWLVDIGCQRLIALVLKTFRQH